MNNAIIEDKYEIGEIATIRNYDVFQPAPSSWNSSRYGIGQKYEQQQNIIVSADLDLYAQYDAILISYYFFDGAIEKWDSLYGSDILIAEYDLENIRHIDNFKCWTFNNRLFFPGDIFVLTSFNVEFLPSCYIRYDIDFDLNGGKGQDIPLMHGDRSTYMALDGSHLSHIVDDIPHITLPDCTAVVDNHYFAGWKIGKNIYAAHQDILLTSNCHAIAQWQENVKYPIEVSIELMNPMQYSVDLNNLWRIALSEWIPRADEFLKYEIFESFSNHLIHNSVANMYIHLTGYNEFEILINSYAESLYDFTIAYVEDSDDVEKLNTYNFQKDPSQGINENIWRKVIYHLSDGLHTIRISYKKNGSVNVANDRGYVAIRKQLNS